MRQHRAVSMRAVIVAAGGLLVVALVIALAIVEAISGGEHARPAGMRAPWANHLVALDEALAAGDHRLARLAYQAAYAAAFASRRWEAMADVGDAAVKLADARRARIAYLTAAYRARAARSTAGVLRAVEGFAALGDDHVTQQWLREAQDLAMGDSLTRARVRAAAERLHERSPAEAAP